MTPNGFLQIAAYFLNILAVAKPMGVFMARLFEGKKTFLHPVLRPVETLVYKLVAVNETTEQRWTQYTTALLAFSIFSFLFVYLLQRLQGILPLNPQGFGAALATPDLSFNTAVSFVTNTNWQSYSGESTLSYLVQMAALTVQNFASAAAGIAIAVAVTRGFARQQMNSIADTSPISSTVASTAALNASSPVSVPRQQARSAYSHFLQPTFGSLLFAHPRHTLVHSQADMCQGHVAQTAISSAVAQRTPALVLIAPPATPD